MLPQLINNVTITTDVTASVSFALLYLHNVAVINTAAAIFAEQTGSLQVIKKPPPAELFLLHGPIKCNTHLYFTTYMVSSYCCLQ